MFWLMQSKKDYHLRDITNVKAHGPDKTTVRWSKQEEGILTGYQPTMAKQSLNILGQVNKHGNG